MHQARRTQHEEPRNAHRPPQTHALRERDHIPAIAPATEAPSTKMLHPAGVLRLQRTAGNRAIQRTLAGDPTIQRRWNPPYLQQSLNQAAQVAAGDSTVYTRYVFQATNPMQEGTGTFIDVVGPLPGAMT